MLLGIDRLLRRRAEPASREAELVTLRARFRAQPSAREAGPDAVASAKRLRELREALAAAFGEVDACHTCARKRPEPNGHWAGGSCCGASTLDLFTAEEVASLKLAGIAATDLEPPRGDHAGCAFRGETGCSLPPAHRPSLCVRYVCIELRGELLDPANAEKWRRISKLAAALRDESTRFAALVSG
ncbi:MAG TPA: hypothetical protein VIF62_08575 [Labilithrix sp.]|jgi:hypothetical protein